MNELELRATLLKLEDLLSRASNKRFKTEILDGINFINKELACL